MTCHHTVIADAIFLSAWYVSMKRCVVHPRHMMQQANITSIVSHSGNLQIETATNWKQSQPSCTRSWVNSKVSCQMGAPSVDRQPQIFHMTCFTTLPTYITVLSWGLRHYSLRQNNKACNGNVTIQWCVENKIQLFLFTGRNLLQNMLTFSVIFF